MKKLLFTLLIASFSLAGTSVAQSIDKEATYLLDGKSRRGSLANVEIDSQGNYLLYYVTKSNDKKVKFSVYKFTSEFEFLSKEDEEIELEKIKTKYSWFSYKGELYSVQAVTLNWNPAMPLVLKKKEISYHYDWLLLGYHKRTKVLEKVKPRTEDGDKYFAKAYFEDEITGDLYIVAGVAPGLVSKEAGAQMTDLRLIKYDWDLNKVAETKIPFEYGQTIAFSKGFAEYDPENPEAVGIGGGAILFAPGEMKGSDVPTDSNPGNFTYVEFDKDLNIKARTSVDVPSPGWKVEDMAWYANEDGSRDVYFYGPSALGKDKFHQYASLSTKMKSIQVMKISKGEVKYVTESDIEDIKSVKKMPPSVTKTRDYTGKPADKIYFKLAILSNNNVLLYGHYNDSKGAPSDYSALQFDENGKLVANYSRNVSLKAKAPYRIMEDVMETSNGVNWLTYEAMTKTYKYNGQETTYYYYFPVFTGIDANGKSIKDPLVLGRIGNKQTYFVNSKFPVLGISPTQQVFFGSDMKEKNIWFCRVNI